MRADDEDPTEIEEIEEARGRVAALSAEGTNRLAGRTQKQAEAELHPDDAPHVVLRMFTGIVHEGLLRSEKYNHLVWDPQGWYYHHRGEPSPPGEPIVHGPFCTQRDALGHYLEHYA